MWRRYRIWYDWRIKRRRRYRDHSFLKRGLPWVCQRVSCKRSHWKILLFHAYPDFLRKGKCRNRIRNYSGRWSNRKGHCRGKHRGRSKIWRKRKRRRYKGTGRSLPSNGKNKDRKTSGCFEWHEPALGKTSKRMYRRRIYCFLPQGIPGLQGAFILDPSEYGLPV